MPTATEVIPEGMLPIVEKPLIQSVVDETVDSGIKEAVLVTHSCNNAIESQVDTSFELEAQLEKSLKRQLLDELRSIAPGGVTVISVRQAEARGCHQLYPPGGG